MELRDTEALLNTLRSSYGLAIVATPIPQIEGEDHWQIDAADRAGQVWVIRGPTYAGAALELALQVGFEVMDG